jgi:hypothetical protein
MRIRIIPDSEEDYEIANNTTKILNTKQIQEYIIKRFELEYSQMLFTVTREDANKGKLVEPGVWYPVEVIKVEEKETKKGADMALVSYQVLAGDFVGTILNGNFMPDYPGFIIDFLAAISGVERTKEFEDSIINNPIPITTKTVSGKKLQVYVTRGTYNNKPTNNIEGYRPYDSEAVA